MKDRNLTIKVEEEIITVWLKDEIKHKGSITSHVYTINEAKELYKKLGELKWQKLY